MGFLSYGSWIVKVRPTSYPMVKVLPWMIRLNRLKVCEKHLKTSRMQSLEGHISWDNFTRLLSLSMQSKLERDICHIPMKRTWRVAFCAVNFYGGKNRRKDGASSGKMNCLYWSLEEWSCLIRSNSEEKSSCGESQKCLFYVTPKFSVWPNIQAELLS